ncbi:Programmed cell death protein 4, partial [Mucuna pruriens]
MPFFHHEVVKKALVITIEKKNERLWGLLKECFESGLITMNQMVKGFGRVAESLDDLALDVPDAKNQFANYVERAKTNGWLDNSFSFTKHEHAKENGTLQCGWDDGGGRSYEFLLFMSALLDWDRIVYTFFVELIGRDSTGHEGPGWPGWSQASKLTIARKKPVRNPRAGPKEKRKYWTNGRRGSTPPDTRRVHLGPMAEVTRPCCEP